MPASRVMLFVGTIMTSVAVVSKKFSAVGDDVAFFSPKEIIMLEAIFFMRRLLALLLLLASRLPH